MNRNGPLPGQRPLDLRPVERPVVAPLDRSMPVPTDARAGGEAAAKARRGRALECARNRLLATGLLFLLAFFVIAGRVVDLTLFDQVDDPSLAGNSVGPVIRRGDIVDRNGIILATSLPTASVYADPKLIIDPSAAAAALHQALPNLDQSWLLAKLTHKGRFVWIRRNLSPEEHYAVNKLGIPGLFFETEYRRVYPHGREAAHVLGMANIDGEGTAGVERYFNSRLAAGNEVHLAIDIRVQHMLREELEAVTTEFRALGAGGLVLDVDTGEVIALVSLPDFDPNNPMAAPTDARFDRITKGVFEMGSVFKVFTVAMALDTGTTTLERGYDASHPLHVARFTITDYHALNRWLSTPEILVHSSNIGAALMALDVGGARQREYLQRLGLFGRPVIELPEVGETLLPHPWRDINTMTVAYGHGIATTPLQAARAVAAVVDGGILRPTTIIARADDAPLPPGERVVSAKTSAEMRRLMRMVVQFGTATHADVPGYDIGGKTGTADKLVDGRYRHDQRMSSFVGAFPMDAPRYVVLAMLDDPKGNRSTYNFATAGWTAAPVVGRVIARMAPLVGIAPQPLPGQVPGGAKVQTVSAGAGPALSKEKQLANAIREAIAATKGIHQVAAN
jgi:cell division protein FtsI (penicillin-binding protein 3)